MEVVGQRATPATAWPTLPRTATDAQEILVDDALMANAGAQHGKPVRLQTCSPLPAIHVEICPISPGPKGRLELGPAAEDYVRRELTHRIVAAHDLVLTPNTSSRGFWGSFDVAGGWFISKVVPSSPAIITPSTGMEIVLNGWEEAWFYSEGEGLRGWTLKPRRPNARP